MTTDEDLTYAGLLIVQPYGKQTTSFANAVINIDNTIFDGAIEGEDYQLYYLYAGSNDMQFTDYNVPTVLIDGNTVLQPVPAPAVEPTKPVEVTEPAKTE